jgi:hypothetical protein
MDALDLLEQQHRDVRELLGRLADQECVSGVDTTIDDVLRAVEAHVRIEEAYVYVACASKLRGEGRAGQAMEQRADILSAARLLALTSPLDPQFRERIAALLERFERHVDIEEDTVFPKLKRTLTDEALDVLGRELERAHVRYLLEDKPFSRVASMSLHQEARACRVSARRQNPAMRSGVRQKVRTSPV